jgi:hypothetical protein
MANARRGIDRWSSSEKAMLNLTESRISRTPLMELSTKSSIDDKSQNDE